MPSRSSSKTYGLISRRQSSRITSKKSLKKIVGDAGDASGQKDSSFAEELVEKRRKLSEFVESAKEALESGGGSTAKASTQSVTEPGGNSITRETSGQVVARSDVALPERELLNFAISGDSSSDVIAQRACIKYFARNGYTATKTLEIIQKAFGDHTLSKTRVFHWHKMFREGRERVEDEPRSGRPSTSTDERHVAQVRNLVINNSGITIRDIIEQVPISFGSCQSILRNHLGLRRAASQVTPKTLKFLQQRHRDQVTEEMPSQGES